MFQRLVNIPRVDDPTSIPEYIGKWFKCHFALGANCPTTGSFQLVIENDHKTEVIYDSCRKFHSPLYLPYSTLKNVALRLIVDGKVVDRPAMITINSVLPKAGSPLSYVSQYQLDLQLDLGKKQKVVIHCYFLLHLLNYSPLSYYAFDIIADLKMGSRIALFDKNEYLRLFVYATSVQYQKFINDRPQVKTQPESLQSFQDQGYLLYITQITEEQTKSAHFPFIEFDSALLQFANRPEESIAAIMQGQLPSIAPMATYDNAVYLRFEIRDEMDRVLAVSQESIPAMLQPFASMQRTASRELVPITVHSIGTNRLQQKLIYNHLVLNMHEKLAEPSVSHYNRKSQKSSNKGSRRGEDESAKWQPPPDQSQQTLHRSLKHPTVNPSIPQLLFEDGTQQDKLVATNRTTQREQHDNKHNDGLQRRKFGPVELPLTESYPPLFNSQVVAKKKDTSGKNKGAIYVMNCAHYHLPTMKESFTKNNVILKPSIVLDYYSDPGDRKSEMDKTVDIMGNLMSRLEPFFSYRRLPHTQKEVDDFYTDYYSQFGKPKLVDPELSIDSQELQREFEPGEPYILRSLEPAGIPLTLLNISPPSHLTPARDLSKVAAYAAKWDALVGMLAQKFPNKLEWQRYEFNNLMKGSNNAYPTVHAPCPGIYRRGIVSSDNRFHRQIIRDGVATDEYSCDIFDGRRLHPLLDLNVAQITPYVDYPLSVESIIYYCRALRLRLRSSLLPLPENFAQLRQDRQNGRMRANDNNSGIGGHTTATYLQEFARELIIRTLLDVESKVYQTNMIEYSIVFVGGFRGTPECTAQIHRILREYCSMLPVSFVFVEYTEKTSQRESEGREHTNGGGMLDLEGVHLVNETGMVTTQGSKYYALQSQTNESLMFPIFTYDRRHLHKLQQEYLYPQRDMILGVKKSWYLDKETKVYEYDKVIPLIKERIAVQVKQYLDIQFKSRCTFEVMAQILYPSPPGVLNTFAVQTQAPMKYDTQCAFFQQFFAADNDHAANANSSSPGAKADAAAALDEKKAHFLYTPEQEAILKQQGRCPCCQVFDTTVAEATEFLFSQAKQSSQFKDLEQQQKLKKFFTVEYTASTAEDNASQPSTVSLSGATRVQEPPPPFMDDIIDTSKFNIKLDHLATLATVRDVTNTMNWHIENLALKIAQFKHQQGGL